VTACINASDHELEAAIKALDATDAELVEMTLGGDPRAKAMLVKFAGEEHAERLLQEAKAARPH
jgi:hypothetical protein